MLVIRRISPNNLIASNFTHSLGRYRYRVFFDTNVLAYLHDKGSPEKRHVVRELLSSWFPTGKMVVSTQVLQELYVVLTKKLKPPVPPGEALEELERLNLGAKTVVVTPELIFRAVRIHAENAISFWDALIVSAASYGGCKVIFTEDLNPGQVIEGVRVENPFVR